MKELNHLDNLETAAQEEETLMIPRKMVGGQKAYDRSGSKSWLSETHALAEGDVATVREGSRTHFPEKDWAFGRGHIDQGHQAGREALASGVRAGIRSVSSGSQPTNWATRRQKIDLADPTGEA